MISISGNIMTIGTRTFIATPDPSTASITYAFHGWMYEGGDLPQNVTCDMTITGLFSAVMVPEIDERGNASIDAKGQGDSVIEAQMSDEVTTLSVEGSTYSIYVSDASDLGGKKISVSVETVDNPSSEVTGTAYEFTFESGGTKFMGRMEVTLPYVPEDGKKAAVYFVDGGRAVKMNVTQSGKDSVTFETDHNSVYVISYE